MTNDLRDLIMANAQTEEIRNAAEKQGMVSLRRAGMDACLEGITTPEEVIRETILDA